MAYLEEKKFQAKKICWENPYYSTRPHLPTYILHGHSFPHTFYTATPSHIHSYQPFGLSRCQSLQAYFSLACHIWVAVTKNRTISVRQFGTLLQRADMRRTTATDVTESRVTWFVQQNETSSVMPSKCQNVRCATTEGPELRSSTVRVFAILQMVKQQTAFEMRWHTRRNQISSSGETDESI
jgi:hypothetical protein